MTDLARDSDGRWRVRLVLGDRYAELWGDETMRWTQVFTGGPNRNWSIAVEPMTCGPDAFNAGPTHDDMRCSHRARLLSANGEFPEDSLTIKRTSRLSPKINTYLMPFRRYIRLGSAP